jgi:hypothetical protein
MKSPTNSIRQTKFDPYSTSCRIGRNFAGLRIGSWRWETPEFRLRWGKGQRGRSACVGCVPGQVGRSETASAGGRSQLGGVAAQEKGASRDVVERQHHGVRPRLGTPPALMGGIFEEDSGGLVEELAVALPPSRRSVLKSACVNHQQPWKPPARPPPPAPPWRSSCGCLPTGHLLWHFRGRGDGSPRPRPISRDAAVSWETCRGSLGLRRRRDGYVTGNGGIAVCSQSVG